jgi:GntR family transcriptional regulator
MMAEHPKRKRRVAGAHRLPIGRTLAHEEEIATTPGLPLYGRVFQKLRDEILSGRYDSGGALPTEFALENRFSISRITVRRAIEELERAGLVERNKGRAAQILPRPPALVVDVSQEIESHMAQGIDMQPRVLSFTWIKPDADLMETLEITEPEERVLWVTRLRRRHGQPVSHTSAHMPERIGRLVTQEALNRQQLIEILRQQGKVAVSAEQIMSAAPATHAIAKFLDLEPGAPLFCIRRLTRDDSGRPMVLLAKPPATACRPGRSRTITHRPTRWRQISSSHFNVNASCERRPNDRQD